MTRYNMPTKDRILLSGDWHFTSKSQDAYRFKIFPWLVEQIREHSVSTVVILGDLTDAKDRHSSALVNQVCDGLLALSQEAKVVVLKGNHDYVDEGCPYFKFIQAFPHIDYVSDVSFRYIANVKCALIPHQRGRVDWEVVARRLTETKSELALLHHTFHGAVTSLDFMLEGDSPAPLTKTSAQVFSGDIHVPQVVGPVTYVGSPYTIRFMPTTRPCRVVVWEQGGKSWDIPFPGVTRSTLQVTVGRPVSLDHIAPGDQVKIQLRGKRRDLADISNTKRQMIEKLQNAGAEVCGVEVSIIESRRAQETPIKPSVGVDPLDALHRFAKTQKVSEACVRMGERLLKQSQENV